MDQMQTNQSERSAKYNKTLNLRFQRSLVFLNEFETPPWVYEKMFRSRDFYVFDESEKKRLALRTDEINAHTLYSINGFINSFFEHLENLDEKTQKPDETETPELSEEEELRLVVTEIQKLLNAAGCNAGVADGIWGRRTQAAAILFAKTAKLPTSQGDLISEVFINVCEMHHQIFVRNQSLNQNRNQSFLLHKHQRKIR